jgi:hypothetical protein
LQNRPAEYRNEDRDVDPVEGRREAGRVRERRYAEQHEHDQPGAIQHALGAIALAVQNNASGVDRSCERPCGRRVAD